MKKIFALVVALCLAPIGAQAWWQSVAQQSVGSAPSYQGPGDVVSGALAWGSCARAYNTSYANGTNPLCDLVDATTGLVAICTLRVLTTGFVDMVGNYCTGSTTPALACAAAAGGSCKVSRAYDQSGNTNHFTQATPANMPGLVFSALNGLPGLQCGSPVLLGSPNITRAQPYSLSTAYIRTSGSSASAAVGAQSGGIILGSSTLANQARIAAGTTNNITGATDNTWHSLQGTFDAGATGAANIDGTDTTGLTVGANAFSANAVRLCGDGGSFLIGRIMEGGMWPAAFTPTQRTNISNNQHSINGYNF